MNKKLQKFFSFRSNSVFYRLTMAFGLFFLGPLVGILFLSVKTSLFGTTELLYCLVGLLISTLFGYIIIRQISDGIIRVEGQIAQKLGTIKPVEKVSDDELENIAIFADIMNDDIIATGESLNKRLEEIHALKELGSLSAFQITAQSLASLALKRSVEVVGATGGSIILLTDSRGICRHTRGSGVRLMKGETFGVGGFPGYEKVLKNQSFFLRSGSSLKWDQYFDENCECAAFIPFSQISGAMVVAVLTTESEGKWDDTTLEFLTTYFNNAGSTLKMQEIDLQKRETTEELKTVLSIIKILNSNPHKKDLLSVITRRLEKILPHDWVGLAMKNETDENFRLSYSQNGTGLGMKTGDIIEDKASLFHLAMKSDEPIAIENLNIDKNYFEKKLFQQFGLQSCIIECLSSNGKPIGAICLGSKQLKGFSAKDKRVFAMVAMGLVIALEQSKMLGRERSKRNELEVLNKIGAALSSHTIRVNRVLHYVLERVAELVDVEAGSVMLLEFDALVIKAAIGEYSNILKNQRISLNHGVAGYVVATGEAVIVDDTRDNPNFLSTVDEKTGFATRNVLCVPMISNGRVTGVIELLNKVGKSFTDEDLQTVKAVTASTAIALENSRLYSETNHIAKKERFIRTVFQKYVPAEIVNDILEKGEADQMKVGERKIVTVFNVDIRGYSRMSKQASTEDVVQVLNYFFKKMGQIVIKHNGVLDKYLGDGLLAIFGAPVAIANPALDAVHAAQEMVKAIDDISILAQDRCGVPIKIGVSINTGEAIVGNIGFDKKMEYTVIGDVVNETFRLQDLTRNKINSILIGEGTYQQVKSSVRTAPYGLKKLDGSVVNVYEVFADDEIQENYAADVSVKSSEGGLAIH